MKKYIRCLLLGLNDLKAFKMNFILSFISVPLRIVIVYYFWNNLLTDTAPGGFTGIGVVFYFICIQLLSIVYQPAYFVTYDLFTEINNGVIISWILRPISYLKMNFFNKVGRFLPRFLIIGLIFSVSVFYGGIYVYLTGLIAVINSFILLYLLQFIIGSLTLRIKNVLSFRDNMMDLLFIFGGSLIPIDLLPEVVTKVVSYTPLPLIFYLPSKIFSASALSSDIYFLVVMQFVWVCIFYIIAELLWKKLIINSIRQGG